MLVLLPPSETKRVGGSDALDPTTLRTAGLLGDARDRVRAALVELSSSDEEAAAKVLKLGVKNRAELAHNLDLEGSGALPAIERYTGVLYDALDVSSLDASARRWIDRHVLVQSALFGLIRAGDRIPAYRLSGGSRLPRLGAPLKRVWADAHAQLDWDDAGFVLDLRSKDYAALAPLPRGVGASLHVAHRGVDGNVRALNHFNKAAKGDLVRRLARSTPAIGSVAELVEWGRAEGLEFLLPEGSWELTLVTELGAPAPASRSHGQAG
ncbi:MAG: YaaA family protein [Leucobacter sp.]